MEEHAEVGDRRGQQEQPNAVTEPEGAERNKPGVPKVWVASLSDYNAGRMHGAWIEITDKDALWEGIHTMLASSPVPGAEEWAIHDYDGFGPVHLHEYETVEDVARLAAGIVEHGQAFAHWANLIGWRGGDRMSDFEGTYVGHFDGLEAYGEHLIEEFDYQRAIDSLPAAIIPYIRIDAEALARDLQFGGAIITSEAADGSIYVFGAIR